MALKQYNPTSPSRRQLVTVDRSALWKGKPVKKLTEGLTKSGGRNNHGRTTARYIGGGHKRVYRNAQSWSDVQSADIASAIIGSKETTLHIYHLIDPRPAPHRKRFLVSQRQFQGIIASIRSTFRLTSDGRSTAHPAYAPDNLFYDSTGHYSAYTTCNEWTGEVLRKAGVRMGIWTPMPGGVMRWFD